MLAIRRFFNKVSDCVRPNTREAADVMHGGKEVAIALLTCFGGTSVMSAN
jgi:hypothetical protein